MRAKQIILEFISENKWQYAAGAVVLIISSITASIIPKLLGIITDGLNTKNLLTNELYKYIILMVLASICVFAFKFVWRYLLIGNCRKIECYMRDKFFKHLQTLPVSFYNNRKTGDLIAYAINDIQAIRMVAGFGVVAILDGVAINSVSIFFMAGTISPILTLMALAPVPLIVFMMIKLRKSIRQRFLKVQEAFAAISEKVQENIMGIRVIKAFAQEDEEVGNFRKYNQNRVDTQMKLVKISALLGPAAQVSFGISFLLFIIFGSELVINGAITLGDYIAFNSYMIIIMRPIMHISRIVEVWQRGIASFRRLDEIFKISTDITDRENTEDINKVKGSIEIRNLNFTYPETAKRVLKNICIKLDRGKSLGILGKTGCGKTTLANLLLRLYNIDDGCIFIDGKDINDIPIEVLREKIGYVPQDNFLFSTTIRENIEFFKENYSEYEVEQAAKMSGVYDNILSFPKGFDTMVGERGVTLSGGQKQRISIARALIKNPSILILDDSLSAVDIKTEKEVLNNIKNVLKSCTGIIISHRISTVMHADEIILMNRGKIVERGSHKELLNLKGEYYKIYRTQTDQNVNDEGAAG